MSDNIRYAAGHRMYSIKISQVVHFIGLKILNAAAVTRDKAMLKIDISVQILAFGMTLFKINENIRNWNMLRNNAWGNLANWTPSIH